MNDEVLKCRGLSLSPVEGREGKGREGEGKEKVKRDEPWIARVSLSRYGGIRIKH